MSWGKEIFSVWVKLFYPLELSPRYPYSMVINYKMFLKFRVCEGEDSLKNKKVTPHREMQGHLFSMSGLTLIAQIRTNYFAPRQKYYFVLGFLIAAWAAARRAIGTRKGEQET